MKTSFADGLRLARERRGDSRVALAECLRVAELTVEYWERGYARSGPGLSKYKELVTLYPELSEAEQPPYFSFRNEKVSAQAAQSEDRGVVVKRAFVLVAKIRRTPGARDFLTILRGAHEASLTLADLIDLMTEGAPP